MPDSEFNIIDHPVIRQDGYEKVTGQAKFADDYHFPKQLAGVMVRLPVAHARIDSVDYSAIQNNPEVVAIVDSQDIPGEKNVGPIRKDQPVFCDKKIVTAGDVIAMLLGENEDELVRLAGQIRVDYHPLPVLTDPLQALKPDAPLIHPQYKDNLIVHYPLRKGDVEKGLAESDYIIEQTYTTPHIEHAYIEPECVTAVPLSESKGIRIIGSIQNPFTTRKVVASVLGWPLTKVRVEQAELGGSFGGKDDTMNILSARAAVGAVKTGRPVKIRYRREESVLESYKRHPYIMHYKVGFMKDGRLKAMKIDVVADGGAYASQSPFVTWRTVVQATGPYEVEHVWTDVRAVYTNTPYTGAFRGFGSPQPIFAQESLMDDIALQLGITPDEIRRINGYRPGSVTASGQKLEMHDVNLLTVLEKAAEESRFAVTWQTNKKEYEAEQQSQSTSPEANAAATPSIEDEVSEVAGENLMPDGGTSLILKPDEFIPPGKLWKKGIGMAVSFRGCSLGAEGIDAAAAYLSLQTDGSAYLLCGLAENGQGLRTTFSIIASEVLGIFPENIYYLELDTAMVPDSGPTVASRSTLMGGGAVKAAAEIIRTRLEDVLRKHWVLPEETEFVFRHGQVSVKSLPRKKISFGELCSLAYQNGVSLAAIGWNPGPKVHWEEETGQGPAYFTYAYGCQVAEVRVNTGTGEVYVDRIVAVHDPGKVINKLGAMGQVYGGVTQGAGYGLWEEVSHHQGFIRELNFDQLMIPTSKDIGEIVPVFVEGKDEYGPWGAKSLGEPTLELTAAAIANAVRNATGVRYYHLPLNIEEIMLRRKLRPEDLKRGSAQ